MEIVKTITLDKRKIRFVGDLGFHIFKRRLLKVGERYGAKSVEFFEQDGTNFRDNKVTVVFYA